MTRTVQASDREYLNGAMGVISGLAMVLSAKLIALLAVAGGIFLTYLALGQSDVQLIQWRLIALGIYAFAVCLPVVFYSLRPLTSGGTR